jgi:stage V sporulation protein AF
MIKKQTKLVPIPSLEELENYMKVHVGLEQTFDIGVRKYKILKKEVHLYYLNGLVDTDFLMQNTEELVNLNNQERTTSDYLELIENRLVHQSVSRLKDVQEVVDRLLTGTIVIVIEGYSEALAIDVRSYPGRTPQEPDTEKVIRGSRDGFVENFIVNTALTRRRIRDGRLRFEKLTVGERSKTDIAIAYLKDVANPDLVNVIKKELEAIEIDAIPMADKAIEEFLVKQGYNPYPLVRYTERADIAATHILEGHVLIYVDTSPSVIITPTTYFQHLHHAEEYRESPMVGTFVRWARFLGVIASLFLLPLWFLFVLEPELLPKAIEFIGPNKKTHIPTVVQIFLADIGIFLLRLAAIHTPTPLATSMGLIAAVLIGQIAIDVGLFVPEVILYVAVAGVGTFTTPSYELGIANTISKLLLLIIVAIFKLPGFVVGITAYILFLASIRSLNAPYLWPFLPFHPKAFLEVLFRRAVPGTKIRPSIVQPRNRYRQRTN